MKSHLIISVGTSIISNYDKKYKTDLDRSVQRPASNIEKNEMGRVINTFPKPSTFMSNFTNIQGNIKDSKKGAEQSSIEAVKEQKKLTSDISYHLIATDTKACLFCASFLGHEVLGNSGEVFYYIPKGLGEADDKTFASEGLYNLLSCLASILDEIEQKNDEALIIPTGGYKAIIPYLTIASILYKKPAFYIYEESTELIELPAPPLSIDVSAFRAAYVLLENIVGLKESKARPYYDGLHDTFQKLVFIKDYKFEYTAFGMRFKKMFSGQVSVSPLVIRATGNTLVSKLNHYRDDFHNIARLGETIWLGDKAPEMADHARHHHNNLFAYAELLLMPILNDIPEFLSSEELFLLLGVVYLHDCGHSLGYLIEEKESTRLPLLPTEIRNYHNLLGFHRLENPNFQQSLQNQGLVLKDEFFKNVALLSVYHRKKMPISKVAGNYTGPEDFEYEPLETKKIFYNEEEIQGSRLALLASLFRIIDGMDKQVARAGDATEVAMKAESVLADLPYLWDRVVRLKNSLSSLAPKVVENEIDSILEIIIKNYGLKESVATEGAQVKKENICRGWGCEGCNMPIKSPQNSKEITEFSKLSSVLGTANSKFLPLAWEYLEARIRFFFQALQPSYYYSDLLLGMPRVTHSYNDGYKCKTRCITIDYPENADLTDSRKKIRSIWGHIVKFIKDTVGEDEPERKYLNESLPGAEQIIHGIRDEYCGEKFSEVARKLREHGIIVVFKFNGNLIPCWQ